MVSDENSTWFEKCVALVLVLAGVQAVAGLSAAGHGKTLLGLVSFGIIWRKVRQLEARVRRLEEDRQSSVNRARSTGAVIGSQPVECDCKKD